jgi:hypothetical protein
LSDTDEHQQAERDLADDAIVDPHARVAHPLNDRSHLSVESGSVSPRRPGLRVAARLSREAHRWD